MEDIVIFGAGGFGREVAWLIEEINSVRKLFNILGFIVDDGSALPGENFNGHAVLGGLGYLEDKKGLSMVIAMGSPSSRLKVLNRLAPYNLHYPNLVHPSVMVGPEVRVGIGNVICAGAILTVNITMGSFCQLNLHTTVGHDCVLGHFATTACGIDLAGHSRIGTGAYLGNHSTVLSVGIGEFATIGAGAVVNSDIPAGATAVGVPAKIIKQSMIHEEMTSQIPEQLVSIAPVEIRQGV